MPLKIKTIIEKFSDFDPSPLPDDSFESIFNPFQISSRKKTKIFNVTKYH